MARGGPHSHQVEEITGLQAALDAISADLAGKADVHPHPYATQAALDALEARVAALETGPPPEPPPDPEPPPSGSVVVAAGDDLAGIVNQSPPGTVIWVEPGAVFTGTLTPPDNMVILSDPGNPFVLDGAGVLDVAVTGSGANVELGGVEIRNYGTVIDESWTNVQGGSGSKRAVNLKTMSGAHFHDFHVHHVDGGIQLPPDGLIENGLIEHAKFQSVKGQDVAGFTIRNLIHRFANIKHDGGFYFDDSYGASVKLVGCTDYLIENWVAEDNHGPGLWADSGNHDAVWRNITAVRNTGAGIFWEINTGPFLLDGFHTEHNHGAANVVISNSQGTSTNPIIVRNGTAVNHDRPNGWAVGLLATGRAPGLAHVRVENVTVDAPIKLRDTQGLDAATKATITAAGCVDTAGNPVGVS